MLTTSAGTMSPARVLVIGAGVAGLSAIATARRLGAVVEAYDVRDAAKEEVQSLGARFVELPLETGQDGAGSGAYASALSEETLRKQQELLAQDRRRQRRGDHHGPGAGRQGAGDRHRGDGGGR